MIIDVHIHLMPGKVRGDRAPYCLSDRAFGMLYSSVKSRLASEEDIIRYLDDSGIDKAVVFGFPWADPDMVMLNNDEVWAFHQRFLGRVIPFACLSAGLGESDVREAERTLWSGFRGLGELAVYDGGWSEPGLERLQPILQVAQDSGVPVMLHVNEPVGHSYPGKVQVDFSALTDLIKTRPQVDFILAHFGGGLFVWALMPEIGNVLGRTYLDTAAAPYLYDSRVYEAAMAAMGANKVLFGSDFPLLGLQRYVKHMRNGNLDSSQIHKMLGENAEAILIQLSG